MAELEMMKMNKHMQRALGRKLSAAEAAGDKEQAKAIRARLGEAEDAEGAADEAEEVEEYEAWNKDELLAEAESRGLEVEGSGEGGRVLKADLVVALEADDAK